MTSILRQKKSKKHCENCDFYYRESKVNISPEEYVGNCFFDPPMVALRTGKSSMTLYSLRSKVEEDDFCHNWTDQFFIDEG